MIIKAIQSIKDHNSLIAIARNKIQCNYTAPSKFTKPNNIMPIEPMKTKDFTPSLISKFWNELCSIPVALMKRGAARLKYIFGL